jgi:hypothetical protein
MRRVSDDPLEWLARAILPPDEPLFLPPGDEMLSGILGPAGDMLSPEVVARALDELWNKRGGPLPPGGYRGGREPFGTVPVVVRPPDWTVEADGYRLVIKDGAIVGLAVT